MPVRAGPSLALADLLAQRPDLVPPARPPGARRRTALVPGCGAGHDALLLGALGYDVWGLDRSADALRAAEENRCAGPDPAAAAAAVRWLHADFFDDAWARSTGTDGSGQFDLVFDYAFLCALPPDARPPDARPRWARRMADLVRPKGRLVCLEFPSDKPLSAPGPPWGLQPEVYEALLSAPGLAPAYRADGSVEPTPSPQPRDGALHRLSIIKPVRTHPAGTAPDGSVADFISVWAR